MIRRIGIDNSFIWVITFMCMAGVTVKAVLLTIVLPYPKFPFICTSIMYYY